MPRIPESLKILLRGHEVEAFFDYDRGEDQWFDALKGVGSPGYPASVEVTKLINAFGVEIPLDTVHEVELESMEQQLIDRIVEIEAEAGCDAPEEL